MNRFAIAQPRTMKAAARLLTQQPAGSAVLKAGGMDVVDHLKEGLISPSTLVNIRVLRSDQRAEGPNISMQDDRIVIEANTTMAELADSPLIQEQAPVIAQALGGAATPQVRNVGTAAGNLLQRPRCWYYRQEQFDCMKKGGRICYAVEGENKYHAIFGGGPCFIVHPSNLAPAMHVLEGEIEFITNDADTPTRWPISRLYHLPQDGVRTEHRLPSDGVITRLFVKPDSASGFYAIKEKQSFDWPLVFACVALSLDGSTIRQARVCAGAVAPIPWMLPDVAAALRGVSIDDDDALRSACSVAGEGADPLRDNAYKAQLLPVAVRRAILTADGRPADPVPVA